MENNAPSTNTGKYTVVPTPMCRLSMFPPLARGGMVVSMESVAGATAMTPGNGFNGTEIRSLNRAWVAPGSISNAL